MPSEQELMKAKLVGAISMYMRAFPKKPLARTISDAIAHYEVNNHQLKSPIFEEMSNDEFYEMLMDYSIEKARTE